jgi:hypothetical protein
MTTCCWSGCVRYRAPKLPIRCNNWRLMRVCRTQADVQKLLSDVKEAMCAELAQLQHVCSHQLCATAA